MRKLRALIEGTWGRWIMLGLLIFLLIIFVDPEACTRVVKPSEDDHRGADIAGKFSILKGDPIEVSFDEFDGYRGRFSRAMHFLTNSPIESDVEIWKLVALREAAVQEGITVTDSELRDIVQQRVRANIWNDKALYKSWIRDNYRVEPAAFEESIRSLLMAYRVLEIYQQSFRIAPPTTREKTVELYAQQNIEFARGHYAALDAEGFLQDAADALEAEKEADKKLKEFFETNPAVKVDSESFRNPRRTKFELMVTAHKVLDEKNYDRIQSLFAKAFPDLEIAKLEPTMADKRDYYGIYRDRLLEQIGVKREDLEREERDKAAKRVKKDEPEENEDGEPKDDDAEPKKDDGDDEEDAPLSAELRQAIFDRGLQVCDKQIDREIRLRGMFAWFHEEAKRNGDKMSIKEVFDHLAKFDDKENPVLSTKPDEGLIHFLDFGGEPLSRAEIEKVAVHGEEATFNVAIRLNNLGEGDLPKLCKKQDVYGASGNGRMIFRVMEVVKPSRKTYDQLTDGEKEDLKEGWYLPEQARERAKAELEKLRKKLVEAKIDPKDFRKEAEAIGCRFYEDEWIRATSYDLMSRPNEDALWPSEYRHMLDRHFLTTSLAQALARDRVKKELNAGSFVEVMVDTRRDTDDPGAAYLFLLLERRKPDVRTIPPDELDRFLLYERRKIESEDQDRWSKDIDKLLKDFAMEFFGPMEKRVQDELKRRADAKRKARLSGRT